MTMIKSTLGGLANPQPQQARQGDIAVAMADIRSALERLDAASTNLAERLDVIVLPTPPSPGIDKSSDDPAQSPLGHDLRAFYLRLSRVNNLLDNLLEKIQL